MFGFGPHRLLLKLPHGKPTLGEFWVGITLIRRAFCRQQIKENKQPFAVSYLMNTWGFSKEAAVLASRNLKFESPDAPNAVIALLRDHGFTQTQISKVVRSCPRLLGSDPKGTILPKVEFFYSVGLSKTQLSQLLCSKPGLLHRSLNNSIIPWYSFLKRLLGDAEKPIIAMKHPSWSFARDVQENFASNAAFLRELGMPDSRISSLVTKQPRALDANNDEFKKLVGKVIEMGFTPLQFTFLEAIMLLSRYKMSTLEQKKDIYRSFGWSEKDIQMAFRMHPLSMCLSAKKIRSGIDFLVRRMGVQPGDIARDPTVLFFSLEKRIIPRWSVIEVLLAKGLIKTDRTLGYILRPTEKQFLDKFVVKFLHDLPQLFDVYQGKLAASELIGQM